MLNLHSFGLEFENNIVIFEIVAKFGAKRKILKFGTKKKSDLGIYGLEFENNIISFKISTLKFV